MKAVVITYILFTIVYFAVADGNSYWGVLNMLSLLIPIMYFMYCLYYNRRPSNKTKEWMRIAIVMTVLRCMYTTAVPHSSYEWIYSTNKFFALIFTVWILIKLLKERYRRWRR